jgi:hypothetical protein
MLCGSILLVNVVSICARLIGGAAVSALVENFHERTGGGSNTGGATIGSEFLEKPVSPLGCWVYISLQATLAQHAFVLNSLVFSIDYH